LWRRLRSRRGICAFVVTATILVCCSCAKTIPYDPYLGESSKSAQTILLDALNVFSSVYSVREQGTESLDGITVSVNIVAGRHGGGGTIRLGPTSLNLVLQGNDLYIRADATSWDRIGFAGKSPNLADRWVRTSTRLQPFGAFAEKLDLTQLLFMRGSIGHVVKEPSTSMDGISVIPLRSDSTGLTLYVRDGRGAPALIATKDAGASGMIRFSDYNTAELPVAPSASVDLASVPTVQQQ